MTLALIGTVLLAILVFAFVLEPLLKARPDEIVVDAVALPDLADDDSVVEEDSGEPQAEPRVAAEERPVTGRVVDRAVGGDLT